MWRPRGQNFADLGDSFITHSLISEMTSYSRAVEPALTAQSWISHSWSQFPASRSSLFVVGSTVLQNLKTDPRTRAIRVTSPRRVAAPRSWAVNANHAKHKSRGEGFLSCARSFHPPTRQCIWITRHGVSDRTHDLWSWKEPQPALGHAEILVCCGLWDPGDRHRFRKQLSKIRRPESE